MNVYEKYCHGICDDLSISLVLRAFSAVVDGSVGRMTFKMVTDEQMRAVLDDDDYAFWIKKKAENTLTARQNRPAASGRLLR